MQRDRINGQRSSQKKCTVCRCESQVSLLRLDATSPKTIFFLWLWTLCSPSNLIAYLNSQVKFQLEKWWEHEPSDPGKGINIWETLKNVNHETTSEPVPRNLYLLIDVSFHTPSKTPIDFKTSSWLWEAICKKMKKNKKSDSTLQIVLLWTLRESDFLHNITSLHPHKKHGFHSLFSDYIK